MGRKNRRERKKQKKIIMFSMIGLVCLLSVGYAAFSSEFLISGRGTIVEPEKETAAKTLIKTVVTTGDGLYIDEYEEGRYVYKGAAPNNYITFNGEEAGWRIISVEADGTLKIMRNSIIDIMAWDENRTNTWSSATLNIYLNGTYKGTIDTTYLQTYDFNIGAVTDGNTDLAAQITSEKSTVWNGDIGLMSLSDYYRANTNTSQCGNFMLNELYYGTCQKTNWIGLALKSSLAWTMTPYSGSSSSAFHLNSGGQVEFGIVNFVDHGVAPVLFLKSDIILSGSGTSGDPYEIIEN